MGGAGVAALRGVVEKGFNRMPGCWDRYEGHRCIASNVPGRKSLGALIAIS